MKKIVFLLVVIPLMLSVALAGPKNSEVKKKADELVVIEIENTRFDHGRAFLSHQFATPHYIGRVNPGQTTTIRIPAPINDNYYTLFVTVDGRVVNSAVLAGNIEPGDKIEWDLFSNMIVWKSKHKANDDSK